MPTEKLYASKNDWKMNETDLWFKGDEVHGYNKLEGMPGVYRYDGQQLHFYEFPLATPENPGYHSISTPFSRGKTGRIWFGTYGSAIGFDGTNFTIINNELLGFDETTGYMHVRSLYEDSQGIVWIGNNGIGVLRYDGETTINFSKTTRPGFRTQRWKRRIPIPSW